jgi:prevent-host-death family protein
MAYILTSQIDRSKYMKKIQSSVAKAQFSELLDEVERGETVVITRHGKPIAWIVPDDEARRRRVAEAIEGIKELRKHTKPATIEEIIAWKNEGRL